MKALLLLFFFFMAVCYFGQANAMPLEEWKKCATKAASPAVERFQNDQPAAIKDLCDFYSKPVDECLQVINASSNEEVQRYIGTYLLHAIIIPQCGTADAAQ